MKKLFVIFFGLLVIIYFVRSPYKKADTYSIERPVYGSGELVSIVEMNNFLEVWAEYLQSDISDIGSRQLSLTMGKASEKFPLEMISWLAKRGWNADRFFYVEQRLKAIVKSAFLQEHIRSTIAILEKQADAERNPQVADNIRRLIAAQKQRINVEKISPEELAMVMPNLVLISDILDGTKPYRYVK